MATKITALFFRGCGISGKFFMVFLITKKISLSFQGEFSLIATNVAILIMLMGYELYTYTNQTLIKDKTKATFVLKNSLVFFFVTYLIMVPCAFLLVRFQHLEQKLFLLFIVLVILEHLSQELFRIYLAIERAMFANFLFFMRTGIWSWGIALSLFFNIYNTVELSTILSAWAAGTFCSVILGLVFLPSIKTFFREKVDLKWLKEALRFSSSIILSTIFLKVVEFSDRYFIDFFLNKNDLGVYMLFFQLANLVNVVIFTLYISFDYPKIMKSVLEKNKVDYLQKKKQLTNNILYTILGFGFVFLIGLSFLLKYLDKIELVENKYLLLLMLLSVLVLNLSYSSHYFLITEKKERIILMVTALSALFNLTLNVILIPFIGIYGAAVALLLSNTIILISKNKFERRFLETW